MHDDQQKHTVWVGACACASATSSRMQKLPSCHGVPAPCYQLAPATPAAPTCGLKAPAPSLQKHPRLRKYTSWCSESWLGGKRLALHDCGRSGSADSNIFCTERRFQIGRRWQEELRGGVRRTHLSARPRAAGCCFIDPIAPRNAFQPSPCTWSNSQSVPQFD